MSKLIWHDYSKLVLCAQTYTYIYPDRALNQSSNSVPIYILVRCLADNSDWFHSSVSFAGQRCACLYTLFFTLLCCHYHHVQNLAALLSAPSRKNWEFCCVAILLIHSNEDFSWFWMSMNYPTFVSIFQQRRGWRRMRKDKLLTSPACCATISNLIRCVKKKIINSIFIYIFIFVNPYKSKILLILTITY